MKVSQAIKNKMHELARLNRKASELSLQIDNYFIDKGYNIESLRSGDGISLEELDYGNDMTNEFCEWIENNSKLV
jgi:hypothetical protein